MDIDYLKLPYDSVFQLSNEFIVCSIKQGIQVSLAEKKYTEGDLKNMYFAGATLFLNTEDEFGFKEVITLSHSDETFGSFEGGIRRLLSIEALKELEKLMQICKINHISKWNYQL